MIQNYVMFNSVNFAKLTYHVLFVKMDSKFIKIFQIILILVFLVIFKTVNLVKIIKFAINVKVNLL